MAEEKAMGAEDGSWRGAEEMILPIHRIWSRGMKSGGRLLVSGLMLLIGVAAEGATAVQSGDWSSGATWGGAVPSGVEEDIVIPAGIGVLLDTDVECGELLVNGRLEVERADRTLTCDSLIVQGAGAEFEVGTDGSRFTDRFVLTLKGEGGETFQHGVHNLGARALVSLMGGTISMHGEDRVEWTHLGANAAAGALTITMSEAVDWRAGEEIVIASSRTNWNEAEKTAVASVSGDGLMVTLTTALSHPHTGVIKSYVRPTDSKTWMADLRAEVGLLTRNITIQGASDSISSGFGAHIMVHGPMVDGPMVHPSGEGYIKGVEIYRGGQKSLIGRYPFHWHLCQDSGAGQYFSDSSVHLSYNRAITIHGTDYATVDNNFCYDHLGHGLFLEDGAERFNVITKNVVLLTRRPAAGEEVIPSDNELNEVQNRTPASFWITNPNNIFEDNVAAGTQGTGYWFIMPTGPLSPSGDLPYYSGDQPWREPLGSFARNKAHSCMNGFDIFDRLGGSHQILRNLGWDNASDHVMDSCTWYANDTGIYAGIGSGGPKDNVIYRDNVFIDNRTGTMLATYNVIEETVFVADSGEGLLSGNRMLHRVYDGAPTVSNCHFVGWSASNANFLQNTGAATKHVNHRFSGITTDHAGTVRASMTNFDIVPPADAHANHPAHPRFWSIVLRDGDGSLSGMADSSVVSNHPFLLVGDESRPANWTNVWSSPHKFGLVVEDNPDRPRPNVGVTRSKPGTPTEYVYYINGYNEHHQLPVIVNEGFLYTYGYADLPAAKRLTFRLDDVEAGDRVMGRYPGFGALTGLSITGHGASSHGTLASLQAAGSSGYFVEPGTNDLYLRPVATGKSQTLTVTWTGGTPGGVAVDSDGDSVADAGEIALGRNPNSLADLGAEFSVNGNFESWDVFSGVSGEQVAGGVLSGISGVDSQVADEGFNFPASAVGRIIVRFRASENTIVDFFWAKDGGGYTGTQAIRPDYTGNGDWQILDFDLAGHAEWNGTITGLRIDPIRSSTANADFEIDWIRSFDPSGDEDGDGIANSEEGVDDVDGDGLPNYLDTNSDGDVLGDAEEVAGGLNPYSAGDMRFEFGGSGAEGWFGAGTVASTDPDVSGAFQVTSDTTTPQDPMMIREELGFSAGQVPMIRVRYEGEGAGSLQLFWSNEDGGFSGTRRVNAAESYLLGSGFVETTFNLAGDVDWDGKTISSLRLDLINGQLLSTRVDWIRVTDGDMDDDGLSDEVESMAPVADVDGDGIDNMLDLDSDGDGAPDSLEDSLGRDPFAAVEEGIDADGDGQSDLFEMVVGTSPDDSGEFYTQTMGLDGNVAPELTFLAKPGRRYWLLRSVNLTSWEAIAEVLSGGTDGLMALSDVNPPAGDEVFYRVGVEIVE